VAVAIVAAVALAPSVVDWMRQSTPTIRDGRARPPMEWDPHLDWEPH